MEEDLISTVNSYFSEITEIQIETSAILETLNNVEHQRKLEIEEKNKVIVELEKELKAQKAEIEKLMKSLEQLQSCEEETDQVVEARDEAKAVIEKLSAEYQIKEELSTSLKKAHNEQLLKFHEAKQLIAELTEEDGKIDPVARKKKPRNIEEHMKS
ncbi:hypothetical protein Q3G72_027914 [Acer saccharum]|nr:hypothetical protein Q3G72_027914 [Acer saccharum]